MDVMLLFSCVLVFIFQMVCSNLGQREAAVPLYAQQGVFTTGYSKGYSLSCWAYGGLIVCGMIVVPLVVVRDGIELLPLLTFDVVAPFLLFWLVRDYQTMQLIFDTNGITKAGVFGRCHIDWCDVTCVKPQLFLWHALEIRSRDKVIRVSIYTRGLQTVAACIERETSIDVRREASQFLSELK